MGTGDLDGAARVAVVRANELRVAVAEHLAELYSWEVSSDSAENLGRELAITTVTIGALIMLAEKWSSDARLMLDGQHQRDRPLTTGGR